jgi:hypothetical protein
MTDITIEQREILNEIDIFKNRLTTGGFSKEEVDFITLKVYS